MRTPTLYLVAIVAAATGVGCHDVESPLNHATPVPVRAAKVGASGPDSTFTIAGDRGWPPTQTPMIQFPWDTWVTLEASGTVHLNAKPKLPNGGGNYVQAGDFGATGGVDHHNGVCFLNLNLQDNYGNLSSFGQCEATPKIDTILSRKLQAPRITRSAMPSNFPYECANDEYTICHWITAGSSSTVRERAIPVTLNKLKSSKRVSSFATSESISFTASKTPDSIYITGGGLMPMAITYWEWIGADSTRNSTPPWAGPCHSNGSVGCTYTVYESGRMVVKAFTGGYEQSSSTTVQCLMTPDDPMLNDSTGDFGLREALMDAMDRSNPDSSPGVGANSLHAGYRRETGGVVWLLPDSSYLSVRMDDFGATECHYAPTAGAPPVTGAIPVAVYHTHPSEKNDPIYGCDKSTNGVGPRQYQGGPGVLPTMDDPVNTGGGSGWKKGDTKGDWPYADSNEVPVFILQKDGTAWRLTPHFQGPKKNNPFHWSAFGNKYDPAHPAGKCTWPKKYYYSG